MYYGKETLSVYRRLAQSKAVGTSELIEQARSEDSFRPFPVRLRRFLEQRNRVLPEKDGSIVDYPLLDYSMEKLQGYPKSVKTAVSTWFDLIIQTEDGGRTKDTGGNTGRANYRDVAFFRDSAEVRENIFAFASALELNREETSELMTMVFHRCPFYVKTPIEAIFYVCSENGNNWYKRGKTIYERVKPALDGSIDSSKYLKKHFYLSDEEIEDLKVTPSLVDGKSEYTTAAVKSKLTELDDKLEAFLVLNAHELFGEENKFVEARRTIKELSTATWRNYTLLSDGELLVFYHFYKSLRREKKADADWIRAGERFVVSLGPTMFLSLREQEKTVGFINYNIDCGDSDEKRARAFIDNIKTFRLDGPEKLEKILRESVCKKSYQLYLDFWNIDLNTLCALGRMDFYNLCKSFENPKKFSVSAAYREKQIRLTKDLDSISEAENRSKKQISYIYQYSKIPRSCVERLAGMPKEQRDKAARGLFAPAVMRQSRARLLADEYREVMHTARSGASSELDKLFPALDADTIRQMDDSQFETYISAIEDGLQTIAKAGLNNEGEYLGKVGWFKVAAERGETRLKSLLMQNPRLFSSYTFRANQDDTTEIDKNIQEIMRLIRKEKLSLPEYRRSFKETINNKLLLSSIVGVDQRAANVKSISSNEFLPKWFTYSFPSERFLGLAINYRPSRGNSLTASALRRLIVLLSFFVFFSEESEPFSDGNKQAKAFLTYLNQNLLRAGLDIAYLDPFCNLFVAFSGKDYPIQFFHSFIREAVKRE